MSLTYRTPHLPALQYLIASVAALADDIVVQATIEPALDGHRHHHDQREQLEFFVDL